MSELVKRPSNQFSLKDAFVLLTLSGLGVAAFQLGYLARPRTPLPIAIVATGGTLSAFLAYRYPSKKRVWSTIVLLIVYVIAVVNL